MPRFLPFPVSIAALIALTGGLAASGMASFGLSSAEHDEEARYLEHLADVRLSAFHNGLNEALDALANVNRLFATVDTVSRKQFRLFTQPLLKRHPSVHAFTYQRAVPASDQADGSGVRKPPPAFAITEFWSGKPAPAIATLDLHLVDYIEPSRNRDVLSGIDAAATPRFGKAIEAATASGNATATSLFRLLQSSGSQRGFVVVMPVFGRGATPADASARHAAVIGHTSAVFRATDLVEQTLGRAGLLDTAGVEMRVYAGGPPLEENLVFRNDGTRGLVSAGTIVPDWLLHLFEREDLTVSRSIEAAGLQWHMVVSRPAGAADGSHTRSWIVLAAGTVISLLAAAYLQSLTRRTAELARANTLLSEDIAARERAERALRESEERFHRLADLSSDWYWEQDADQRLTVVRGMKIIGYTPNEELLGKALWDLPFEAEEAAWASHRAHVASRQAFTDVEYRLREPNGRVRWITVNGEPVFDEQGHYLGYRGTAKDLTERKEAELALRQSQNELRELTAHQERVKEDERKRIAREIHDDLGQNLLALRIDVSMLDSATAAVHPVLNAKVRGVLAQIDSTMRSIRAIINDLRPSVLDLGLMAAIEWQVQQFRRRHAIPCDLLVDEGDFDALLDEESATSVFRIVQESLTNISRHAYASRAEIRIRRDGDMLVITIADDGVGTFPGNQRKPRSFGLIGIRERVHRMDGEFRVDSQPGQGTVLTISIAIRQACADAA